jgi:hypothetical protein
MKNKELPMTAEHQGKVLNGEKTSTLRSERYEPGVYPMLDRDGGCQGCCEVVSIDEQQVWWTGLKPAEQEDLAISEGYAGAAGLERALLKLGHRRFVRGMRGLWRHRIRAAE